MAVSLLPWITQYFPDSNGNPLAGGSIETFAAGTSTPKNTWSDPSGTVLNANPIPLGANGQPISGGIYGTIGEAYKIVVKNASGVVQPCSKDNVLFPATTSGGGGGGSYLDKVTTTPQSVASAVTWAELQSMSKGLSITAPDAGGWAMKIPDGSWLRPQTVGQALYLTNGANPSTLNSVLHLQNAVTYVGAGTGTQKLSWLNLSNGYAVLRSSNGTLDLDTLELATDQIRLAPSGGGNLLLGLNGLNWFRNGGAISIGEASTLSQPNSYTNSIGHTFAGGPLTIPLPTGTPTQLVGWDSAGKLVQAGSAPAGGFVALSGHNDLGTTPWSIADDTTFAASDAGIQFDPMGAYQAHLKGNLLIDQGVSNVLTLYRQAFAIGTTQDLIFGAQNDLGNPTPYVHQHSYITANAAGAEEAEWRLQTRVAGAMVERIRANATGGILSGVWRGNFSGYGMGTTALDIGYARIGPKLAVDISSPTGPMYQMEIDSTKVYQNFNLYYSGGFQSKAAALPSAQMIWDSATGGFVWYTAPAGSPASLTQILSLSSAGKLGLIASTAATAPFNLPTGVAVTSPVTGDVWSAAADQLQWRSGANTRRFGFLEVAQTWSAVQTFSSTPVVSSTTASTTAGALYKRTGYGHVGYEAGMAQEFLSNVYTGPVGTALTNSVTETDVTGGTALFGTRTTSTSVWQNGTTICGSTTALITNTASANTITFKVKYGATTVMTIVASVAVVATAQAIKIWFEGVATAAPGASVETIWLGGIEGGTILSLTSITNGATNVATNAATAISMTAQWGTALATSTYHTKATKINLI